MGSLSIGIGVTVGGGVFFLLFVEACILGGPYLLLLEDVCILIAVVLRCHFKHLWLFDVSLGINYCCLNSFKR